MSKLQREAIHPVEVMVRVKFNALEMRLMVEFKLGLVPSHSNSHVINSATIGVITIGGIITTEGGDGINLHHQGQPRHFQNLSWWRWRLKSKLLRSQLQPRHRLQRRHRLVSQQ